MSQVVIIDADTEVVLFAAGLIFLWGLGLGVWKYRQMAFSETHLAHPYIDTAHRAALLYSFATLLIAVFVELSGWSVAVNLVCAGVLLFYFVVAIGTYAYLGWRGETDNQWHDPPPGTTAYMTTLIVGEMGAFAVLLAGFARTQF